VTIQINVKDLPEHHLELIAPTDPAFIERLVDALADKGAHPLAEELKRYCVLFENKGTKVVVGYRVKWEITRADGTVSVQQAGGLNAGALMGKRQEGPETPPADDEFVLKPGSTTFVSLAGSPVSFGGGSIIAFAGGSSDPAAIEQFRRSQD
jgi:hypothetical protein